MSAVTRRLKPTTITEPWKPATAQPGPSAPGVRVSQMKLSPSVTVTVRELPEDGRFFVQPGEKVHGAGFMAEWRALRKGAAHG